MIFRKSVTPSSARATPDQNQNRKSYASGISISSNSSLNSLRVGNASLQPRANPALTGSRLPTAKPRNVHSSAGVEEEEYVPPVPAIPKAYESPKDPENKTFSFSVSTLKAGAAIVPSPERTTSDDMASSSLLKLCAVSARAYVSQASSMGLSCTFQLRHVLIDSSCAVTSVKWAWTLSLSLVYVSSSLFHLREAST